MNASLLPTCGSVADFSADLFAAARALSEEMLSVARDGAIECTGARLSSTLERPAKPSRAIPSGTHVSVLLAASEARLAHLDALTARALTIGSALEGRLRVARTARHDWMADPPMAADALDLNSLMSQLDRRLANLQAALTGTKRARLVLAQARAAEQLVRDQLLMARDVAVPMAARETRLRDWAPGSRDAATLEGRIDRDVAALLGKDRVRSTILKAAPHR